MRFRRLCFNLSAASDERGSRMCRVVDLRVRARKSFLIRLIGLVHANASPARKVNTKMWGRRNVLVNMAPLKLFASSSLLTVTLTPREMAVSSRSALRHFSRSVEQREPGKWRPRTKRGRRTTSAGAPNERRHRRARLLHKLVGRAAFCRAF